MKIWTHHYELNPGPDTARAAATKRRGTLLKVTFDDDATGYADLHPWTEFGHPPLEDNVKSLQTTHPTHLANLALRHARTDAVARHAGVSLFDGLPEVRSHALFTDWTKATHKIFEQCAENSYASAKLKVGLYPDLEAEKLNRLASIPLRWRLDANGRFAPASLASWLQRLSPEIRRNIEFLEDPCPYDPEVWPHIATREKTLLALDWQLPDAPPPWPGAGIIVLKPASQDTFTLAKDAARHGMEIVVTHSMDHPLGRAVAQWTSMRLRQRHGDLVRDGGLQGAALFASDAFSKCLEEKGSKTITPQGTGFGFDTLLGSLVWRALA